MAADALHDCSRRGGLVLDAFGVFGSTLIAAQVCGRSARVMELDPLYCDTIINRWQLFTGKKAKLVRSGECFEELAEQRLSEGKKAVGFNTALFLATSFNLVLPKRFRIGEIAFVTTTMRLEITPKRELMKMIEQASLALGFEDTTYGLAPLR